MLPNTVVVLALLLIAISGIALGQFECRYAIGKYRNCTCGVQYRTVEKRCCSSEECLLPELSTENLTCTFECENGGSFDSNQKMCKCQSGRHGVCCEKATPFCGGIFLNHTGQIISPNFPNHYPNNAKCIWEISTDPNRRIALGSVDNLFDVEPGNNIYSCTYDHLKVFDGRSDRGKCLGTFCGKDKFRRCFQTVYSLSSSLFVQFSSDFIVGRKGFKLQYSVFFKGQECGPKQFFRHTKGIITSPQFPIPYPPNQRCQWTIQINPGHNLLLSFKLIDIKASMYCRYGDYLIVSGRKTGGKLKHLNAFCGGKVPRPYTVEASNGYSEVVLTFRTDQTYEGRGFVLNYLQVPLQATSKNTTAYTP